ncbi:MAG TPA: PH domain-containing protein [Burkholderiales bacterium]|nr:PH domain-containing protein [Burkholderiales bacterium]
MSYVESVLAPGEQVLYRGRVSGWSLFWYWIVGLLLLVVGVGLIVWIVAWIKLRSTELAVTNKRVVAKFGFISRETIEINLARIESVQVNQTVMGRMLDYGTIVFSGAGTPQATIPSIASPLEFRKAVVGAQS